MVTHYYATFERFYFLITDEDALSGSVPGQDATEAVKALLQTPFISEQIDSIPADDIKAELSEYGAWDDDELSDTEQNKIRILWIACGNIREEIAEMEREEKS